MTRGNRQGTNALLQVEFPNRYHESAFRILNVDGLIDMMPSFYVLKVFEESSNINYGKLDIF